MKEFYGNYLGVVVTGGDKDPEGRGRTQIFIPNIMPALYKLWNEQGEDISFDVIGEGLEGSLNPEILQRLQQVLPWAECAVPITGSSPSYKPSVLGQASEVLRNVGSAVVDAGRSALDAGKAALGIDEVLPGDKAGDLALSNAASKYSYASGKCGTAVGEILEGVYGYSEAEIRAGSSTKRRDGKEYSNIMRKLGWKEKVISKPEDAPPGSVLDYGPVPGNPHGHVEMVGTDANGKKVYHFGLGAVTTPAGGSGAAGRRNIKGFKGVCFVPPPDVKGAALQKLGRPTTNPSADAQASTTNMTPDPGTAGKNEAELTTSYDQQLASTQSFGNQNLSLASGGGSGAPTGFGSIDGAGGARSSFSGGGGASTEGISAGALEYAMRTAAAESRAGVGDPKYVVSEVSDLRKAVGYSQAEPLGIHKWGSRKVSNEEVRGFGDQIIKSGKVDYGKTDLGYSQLNYNDSKKYGLVNSGSYKEQVLSLARHVQNQANKEGNSAFALALKERRFSDAEYMNKGKPVPGWNNNIYRLPGKEKNLEAKGDMSTVISKDFGGDPFAAMEQINSQLPPLDSIETMLGPDYKMPDVKSVASSPSIKNPTSHPGVAGPNTNNQALGMFGYASEGQAVWVFFREGNPLFPVYFAASYGQAEWASMFGHASPGIGAGVTNPQADGKFPNAPTGAIPGTEASQWNSYGGGIRSASSTDESPLGVEFLFQLYGKNGAHFTFLKNHTEFYSPYDHVSRVMADHQDITEANKEVRVRGDYNTYAEQDLIISVGNWSQEAIDASDEIQKYITEAMKIKTEAGNS